MAAQHPPPQKPLNWRHSAARDIIITDLEPGGLLFGNDDVTAEEAWGFYSQLPAFARVTFEKFQERLTEHRRQCTDRRARGQMELEALRHDRQLFPRESKNQRGELVFDLTPAKLLLRDDVKNRIHKAFKPSELQLLRPEYQHFKPEIFRQRIYQEVRRQKFVHYLQQERAKILRGEKKKKNK